MGACSWQYPSYLTLLDTPVCMGRLDKLTSDVCGTAFHHVFIDAGVGAGDRRQDFVDRVKRVSARYHRMFGSFPFRDYTFVYHWIEGGAGIERLTSTMRT